MSRRYESLEAMFAERGIQREDSYDFGVWWLDADRVAHSLTWIGPVWRSDPANAGELYLVPAGGGSQEVELLCVIPPRDPDRPHRVEGRVVGPFDGLVEEILEGWAEACGTPNSVEWVRDRAREAVEAGWASEPDEPARVTVKLDWSLGEGHDRVRVFVGPDRDHLAFTGTLTMRRPESEAFRATVRQGIQGPGFTGMFEGGWPEEHEATPRWGQVRADVLARVAECSLTQAEIEAARERLRPYIEGYPEPMIDARRLRIANGTASDKDRREVAAEDVVLREVRASRDRGAR